MAIEYLKKAEMTAATGEDETRRIVAEMLSKIEMGGEIVARDYGQALDKYTGEILVSADTVAAAADKVPQRLKDDLQFAYDRVRGFAEKQRESMQEFEAELSPGLWAGQKLIPMQAAGCYVPGGRYAHVASAIMSIATAKVAGVEHVVACSAPNNQHGGIHPAILYTMNLCGAAHILALGGVQGIAAMAIIADKSADPHVVATDLVGQAEHGPDSPAWLITTSRQLAMDTMARMQSLIDALPEVQRNAADAAWRDYGEVVYCDTDEEAAKVSDDYAPEHLEIQTENLDWYVNRLKNYGSLFVGEETTVAFGDKCSGTNHILPTKGAGHYTGGLSVHKFIKVVTTQWASKDANRDVAAVTARISRLEGMEGHARTGDVRLEKYFPSEQFELGAG